MIIKKNLKVDESNDDTRIDKWLKRKFSSLNQSFIQNQLRRSLIKVNDKKVKASLKVLANDIVSIYQFSEKKYSNPLKEKNTKTIPNQLIKQFKDSVIYECENFLILNKWSGIATQGVSKIAISVDDIIKKFSKIIILFID